MGRMDTPFTCEVSSGGKLGRAIYVRSGSADALVGDLVWCGESEKSMSIWRVFISVCANRLR